MLRAGCTLSPEGDAGSLKEGKAADSIAVDQNVLDAKPLDIKNTKVLQTCQRGKRVFDAATVEQQGPSLLLRLLPAPTLPNLRF